MFSTGLDAKTNVDTITDFTQGEDVISLASNVFSALVPGALTAAELTLGTKATTANQHIVYDQGTGNLFYDADGSGSTEQVLFATLNNKAVLTYNDFFVA